MTVRLLPVSLLLATLFLAACTTFDKTPRVQVEGRLIVNYVEKGDEHQYHSRFRLIETAGRREFRLISFFGPTLLTAVEVPGEIEVQIAKQPTIKGHNWEEIAAQVETPIVLPLPAFFDWLKGELREASGNKILLVTDTGEWIAKEGWQVGFLQWNSDKPRLYAYYLAKKNTYIKALLEVPGRSPPE